MNKITIRRATDTDISGIVALNVQSQARLEVMNPVFWKAHPDAPARFEAWMHKSLTLEDRAMFVAMEAGAVVGYLIAQVVPAPPIYASQVAGLVDDFFVLDERADLRAALLEAGEAFLRSREVVGCAVMCAVKWEAKREFLERKLYAPNTLWMWKTY